MFIQIVRFGLLIAGIYGGFDVASAAAAPSPRQLLEVADFSGLALSPDGRFVAFRIEQASVDRNTYDSAWYIEAIDGSPPIRVADGGVPLRYDFGGAVNTPPSWSADSRWIYYRALLNGEIQVWRAARDGSSAEPVTHDSADVKQFALSPDGRRMLYAVGADRIAIAAAEDAEYDAGVRIDKTIPIGQGLYRSAEINGRLASVRMSGDWSDRRGLLADQPERRRIVDLASLTVHDAEAGDETAFANVLPVSKLPAEGPDAEDLGVRIRAPSGRAVAFLAAGPHTVALRVAPSDAATAVVNCPAPACRDSVVAATAWRPGHNQLIFTTSDHDRGRAQSLHLWDLTRGVVRDIIQAPGLLGDGRGEDTNESCAVGTVFAVCVAAAADDPPALERITIDTGEHRLLYAPNSALAAAVGPRAQLLHWKDALGRPFTGVFFPPVLASPAPAPLFVTYYSCPGYLRGGAGDEWPLASLAGAGIGALCVNEAAGDNRLHPDQLARYRMALSGVNAIVEQLSHYRMVDANRVGMGGFSFGSEIVLYAAMTSGRLAAASVASTSVTPSYYRFHSLQGSQFLGVVKSMWGLGAPAETPDRWRLISPAFNIAKIRTPLLLQMPEQEYIQALDYFAPLANSPTPTEMYVFPNEPHQKYQPRHKLAVYQRNLDWFRFWLQGYVDPDPAKAAQYARWTAMRDRATAAGQLPDHDGDGFYPPADDAPRAVQKRAQLSTAASSNRR